MTIDKHEDAASSEYAKLQQLNEALLARGIDPDLLEAADAECHIEDAIVDGHDALDAGDLELATSIAREFVTAVADLGDADTFISWFELAIAVGMNDVGIARLAEFEAGCEQASELLEIASAWRRLGDEERCRGAVIDAMAYGFGPDDAAILLPLLKRLSMTDALAACFDVSEGDGLGADDRLDWANALVGIGEYARADVLIDRALADGATPEDVVLSLAGGDAWEDASSACSWQLGLVERLEPLVAKGTDREDWDLTVSICLGR